MKPKKSPKKEIILKSDKSFDEMLEDAFNDKVLKKDKRVIPMVLTIMVEEPKKKAAKKSSKPKKSK